ncbi:unnamed protein product [Spirodela intermedia]|uniref:Uncharacterized protein n=1 Tax=Spirodela intermedia TaxID=51605 RepID=A0A7I8LL51_SPIIN|nr:unnamed protein product [Spirodela intermedia]
MGCARSKLDDNEAVALCKDRFNLLSEAIQLRYGLADAHAEYLMSLRRVGESLHKFFDEQHFLSHPSPILTLPTQRKGDPMPPLSPIPAPQPPAATAVGHHLSRSNSGSHLHLDPSDSDFSDDDDDGPLHSVNSSPTGGGGGAKTYVSYAKKVSAGPVVSYEMPPPASPEVVKVGEPSFDSNPYLAQGSDYGVNPYYYPPYSTDGGMGSNFFGGSSPPPPAAGPSSAAASSSAQPPPPPSPPTVSGWDFLNPFESYNNYYAYTPSRSSKDVREEEGIPDLEDEETEVIKEAYGDQKHIAAASSSAQVEIPSSRRAESAVEEKALNQAGPSGGDREDEPTPADEAQKGLPMEVAGKKPVPQSRAASEVAREIKVLFLRASQSCDALSGMLEVDKRPYHRKNAIVPTMSLTSGNSARNGEPEGNEEVVMESVSLSSTLQKLYIWERKLYEEVRAEEEMRLLLERKSRLLKRLDDKGAEDDRINATQAKVKKLSTRIGVAIQVVDSISRKVSALRDEELWPQLNELIQGFVRMWRALMECHKSQWEAVIESRSLDAAAAAAGGGNPGAARELELELLAWIERFCSWFNTQKKFAAALNAWLLRIIRDEPEVTADGVAPFSPGRLGAPPVFVVCNQWSQAMENTSDREVVDAMQAFASSVLQLWDQRRQAEQPAAGGKDQARKLRAWEKDEQAVQGAVAALNRKLSVITNPRGIHIYGEMLHQGHALKPLSLHEDLRQIFDAMERLADSSVRIYDGLLICARTEQERAARGHGRDPP